MRDAAPPAGSKRVLVVEDDVSLRRLVVKHLEKMGGLEVIGFDNGESALEWLGKNEPPHLVCLDLALPAMSGFRVCEAIRSLDRTRRVPIIVITARTTVQDHTFALEVGADAFIEKPFKLKDLENEVHRLLGQP